ELGEGYYYSLSYAEFINHSNIILVNSVSTRNNIIPDERNYFGILNIPNSNDMNYISTNYSLPTNAPRKNGNIRISHGIEYFVTGEGKVYMHSNRDNNLISATGQADSIRINLSNVGTEADTNYVDKPWIDRVLEIQG